MTNLLTINDLNNFLTPELLLEALSEVTVSARIESFLEDLNVDPMKLDAQFDMGGKRRTHIFHASSVGTLSGRSLCTKYPIGCGRELYYSYTGAPSKENWQPRTRRILDTGTAVHAQLQRYLSTIAKLSGGMETFIPEGDVNPEENEIASCMDLSGHTDGIYTITTLQHHVRFGIEIKTINDSGYKYTKSPHPEHKVQGTIYQKCLDLPVMLFVYYNKNDSNLAEYYHVFDPEIWEAIVTKINFVRDHAINDTEPPQEVSWQCGRCKFRSICNPPKVRKGASSTATRKFNKDRR